MSAITISRQLGSQGCQVAREVASRLGYQLVWREAINRAAIRAGAPEVALAVIDELGIFGLHPDRAAVDAYLKATAQVMEELADEGNVVIVGRAGQVILRGREDVFHVRVIAPARIREARLVASQGISVEAARAQVKASDRTRRRYLRSHYNARWEDPDLYDLVVSTARISPEEAGGLICRACEGLFCKESGQTSPASVEIECD